MPSPKSTRSKKSPKPRRFGSRFFVRAVLAIAILAAAAASEANEEKHGGAEAGKEGAKPGAEHRLLEKEKPTCRWSEHESRLTSYMTRIRSLEKEISDMIAQKHHTENADKANLLTRQITFKYSDLTKAVREYEQERLHIRFQHPDRDLDGNREYAAHPLKSLDEIEVSFGLDGRLDRIRRQVGIVFPSRTQKPGTNERAPAAVTVKPEDDDEMPTGIKLVK